jgi:hypothetical protein
MVEALMTTLPSKAQIADLSSLRPDSLSPGSLIDVETKSRHYCIECLGGEAIRISGHPEYCPQPVLAHLLGSIGTQGELELGLIAPGRRLVFLNHDRPVTTSKVVHVHVEQPGSVS